MLTCLLGTRAQLIKMAPVLRLLESRGIPFKFVLTGQHRATIPELIAEFNITTPPTYLYEGKEITGLVSMALWFPRVLWKLLWERQRWLVRSPSGHRWILVHGDTFSTLLGAVAGRIMRATVLHVESGLRSFNLMHPFPEEITRILCFRLADVAFCPGSWTFDNMGKYKLIRIDTTCNTLIDAVRFALDSQASLPFPIDDPYCVVSIHRFENIFNTARLRKIVALLERIGQDYQIVFVMHPTTERRLTETGIKAQIEENNRFRLIPRMTYVPFIGLIHGAHFVVTDGGSNQEELSYMSKATLIMRRATERREGLNTSAVLCDYDLAVVEQFLCTVKTRWSNQVRLAAGLSPSKVVVDYLMQEMHVA